VDSEHDTIYTHAKTLLAQWKNITQFIRMTGDDALAHVGDEELDFIYIDARHDYCAVKNDVNS
jgi:hypothetical protein